VNGRLESFNDREESVRTARLCEEAPHDQMVVISKVNEGGMVSWSLSFNRQLGKGNLKLCPTSRPMIVNTAMLRNTTALLKPA
jgi:hypothetical protein